VIVNIAGEAADPHVFRFGREVGPAPAERVPTRFSGPARGRGSAMQADVRYYRAGSNTHG